MAKDVYRNPLFLKAIDEHFDRSDNKTRKILMAVDEADQNQILATLTSKLYDSIVNKVDDIDFGDIPRTKGDVTKLPNYDKIIDCIKTLNDILVQYKQPTEPVDTIDHALTNLRERKELFEKAYRYDIELPMVVYNTIYLSVISSISLMIATAIEYIKTPGQEGIDVSLDKAGLVKTRESLLFVNLRKFNASCNSGQMDNALEGVVRNKVKNLTGIELGVAASTLAVIGVLFAVIPIIRELIFFFYYSRTRVSEYFDAQADFLQINAHNIDNNKVKTQDDRKRVVTKQLKIVELLRKASNKIAVDAKTSEHSATKEITNTAKQKIDDVTNGSVPDSASDALF